MINTYLQIDITRRYYGTFRTMASSAEFPTDTKKAFLLAFLACVACTAILFLRKPGAFQNPQFWAEDATVFFKSAFEDGWSSVLVPYSGYFHLYPRLISCLAVEFFPVRYQPHIFNGAALFGLLFVVSHLFVPRVNVSFRFVLALLLVLAPIGTEVGVGGSEVIIVLTNTHWFLAVSLLLLVISRAPQQWTGWLFDVLTLVVVGFTGPFLIPFSSLFLIRALWERRFYPTVMCALAASIAIIQALNVVDVLPPPGNYTIKWHHYLQTIAAFFGPAFLGPSGRLTEDEVALSCSVAVAGILCTAALSAWFLKIKAYNRLALIAGAAGIGLVTIIKYRYDPLGLIGGAAPRYFNIPTICLLWAIAMCMKESPRIVASVLCAVCVNFFFSDAFVTQPYNNFKWRKGARCIERSDTPCAVPINPAPWVLVAGGHHKVAGG